MPNVSKIHQDKQPIRRHFLAEWLEKREMSAMDLLNALNDPERSMDFNAIDKSQVYRWLKGQLPHPQMQLRIVEALGLDDAGDLLRSPEDDWFNQFFKDRTEDEIERMKQMLEAAFPVKKQA